MKYICILQNDDGSILVKTSDQAPQDNSMDGAQPVKDAQEAGAMVEQALGSPDQDDGMAAAQAGYDKTAGKRMSGATEQLGAMFGE
jgi:hypothetical protein